MSLGTFTHSTRLLISFAAPSWLTITVRPRSNDKELKLVEQRRVWKSR